MSQKHIKNFKALKQADGDYSSESIIEKPSNKMQSSMQRVDTQDPRSSLELIQGSEQQMQSKSVISDFYKSGKNDGFATSPFPNDVTPSLNILPSKRTLNRKVSKKLLQAKLINKLETGWQNSYSANLGTFQSQLEQNKIKNTLLIKQSSTSKLKSLRQVQNYKKYGKSQMPRKTSLRNLRDSPEMRRSQESLRMKNQRLDPIVRKSK